MRPPEPNASSDSTTSPESGLTQRVIFVPTRKVGYLIGHAGRTISGFERQTGAKIDVLAPNSREKETPVALLGTPIAISQVIRLIMDLYGSYNFSSQLWRLNDCGKGEILGTEQIQINPDLVGHLIEANGEAIQNIERQSGAKVVIHQDQEEVHLTPVDVTGTAEQNAWALLLLREKIFEFEVSLRNPGGGSNSYRTMSVIEQPRGFMRKKLWTVKCSKQPKWES